jgi:hypothetical protein
MHSCDVIYEVTMMSDDVTANIWNIIKIRVTKVFK